MKGYQRNFPCPCGSGLKWKKCHPDIKGVYKDSSGIVIKDRKPDMDYVIGRKIS